MEVGALRYKEKGHSVSKFYGSRPSAQNKQAYLPWQILILEYGCLCVRVCHEKTPMAKYKPPENLRNVIRFGSQGPIKSDLPNLTQLQCNKHNIRIQPYQQFDYFHRAFPCPSTSLSKIIDKNLNIRQAL